MQYNNKKHLELLNYYLECEKQSKSLNFENRAANSELNKYDNFLHDHIFWINRKKFILLVKSFVEDSLEFEQFETNFSLLWEKSRDEFRAVQRDLEQIKNFHPNPRSYGFSSWTTVIYRKFEELEDEYCTEQDIKDFAKEVYLKFQHFLNEE